jgi:hypothetical protein
MCREFSCCRLPALEALKAFACLKEVGLCKVYGIGWGVPERDSLVAEDIMCRLDLVRRRPKLDLRVVVLGR